MSPTMLFAAATLAVAAPKLKDPANAPPQLVGRWEVVQCLRAGARVAAFEGSVHEYTADGKRVIHRGGTTEEGRTYESVPKSDPPAVNLSRNLSGEIDHFQGVYKIEKDTLTLCVARPGGDRPTAFESTAENGWTLTTFKRVLKKE